MVCIIRAGREMERNVHIAFSFLTGGGSLSFSIYSILLESCSVHWCGKQGGDISGRMMQLMGAEGRSHICIVGLQLWGQERRSHALWAYS